MLEITAIQGTESTKYELKMHGKAWALGGAWWHTPASPAILLGKEEQVGHPIPGSSTVIICMLAGRTCMLMKAVGLASSGSARLPAMSYFPELITCLSQLTSVSVLWASMTTQTHKLFKASHTPRALRIKPRIWRMQGDSVTELHTYISYLEFSARWT